MESRLPPTLFKQQQGSSGEHNPLAAVKDGKPAVFLLHDPKVMRKTRVSEPMLLIAPASLYGINSPSLVFSMPGYGCEVMEVGKLSPSLLYRMGLSMKAAQLLVAELDRLFQQ